MATLLVMHKPSRHRTLVTALCLEATLVAAATVINRIVHDVPADGWFTWLIALGSVAFAGLMWWARIVARRLLKQS